MGEFADQCSPVRNWEELSTDSAAQLSYMLDPFELLHRANRKKTQLITSASSDHEQHLQSRHSSRKFTPWCPKTPSPLLELQRHLA